MTLFLSSRVLNPFTLQGIIIDHARFAYPKIFSSNPDGKIFLLFIEKAKHGWIGMYST